jgi:hypothetical protein
VNGNPIKTTLDAAAAVNAFAALLGWLPHIASVLSIAWLIVQFYDRHQRKKRERSA